LTVARGKNGTTPQDFSAAADLFGLAIGHRTQTLDVRANRSLPQERRKLILNRLRKPATLYERKKFVSKATDIPGPDLERTYPRAFGRHTDPDPKKITAKYFPSTNVDVDPDGSLSRFLAVLKRPGAPDAQDVACKAIPPNLRPGASLPTGDNVAKVTAIDDFYWPWTQADMPMLKDYAFTEQQYESFKLWAEEQNNLWNGTLVFDEQAVLATFFGAMHTPDEYFAHLAAKYQRFAPSMIDMANLGAMLGGSFMPGIEVGYDGGMPENWSVHHGPNPLYPDVRFWPHGKNTPHVAGRLTINLAVPWQGDFDACNETFWPTSRPEIVRSLSGSTYPWLETARHQASDPDFRAYWKRLGFIRRTKDPVSNKDLFVEQESVFSRP
jgi:hypothetical protein